MPKTELHRKLSEQMAEARRRASAQIMTRAQFVAESRFCDMASKGSTKAGLAILEKLDKHYK